MSFSNDKMLFEIFSCKKFDIIAVSFVLLPFESCPLWALVELIKIHTIPQQNMEKIAKSSYKETRLSFSIGLPADKENFTHHF
jgi:hypothetical protein